MDKKLIQIFQDRGCLQISKTNSFTYASGLTGPIYCDNRLILGDFQLRNLVKENLIQLIKSSSFQFEGIMAMATGAIAIGAALADELEIPFGYIRSVKKGHGKGELIEGGVSKEKRILIFEDLINQGSSVLQGVEALREENYQIAGVLSIVNYGFSKPAKIFETEKLKIESLISFKDLIEHFDQEDETGQIVQSLMHWHQSIN